MIIQPQLSCF